MAIGENSKERKVLQDRIKGLEQEQKQAEDFLSSNSLVEQEKESRRRRIKQAELSGSQQIMQAQRAEMQMEQMNRNWQSRSLIDPLSRSYLQRQNMFDQYRSQESYYDMMVKQMEERQLVAQNVVNSATNEDDKALAQTQLDAATASLDHYKAALESAREGMKKFADEGGNFKTASNMLAASLETAAQAADKLIQNFGRKVIRQVFTEAKNFVTQFDGQMRNIQAITMKTDEQMESIKKATIDRAIELRTSVANVATVEADLYRQGLNDQQVEERSSAIIKFATVTGAKMTDAGKAITTAIQNGLVDSAEEAMDVLTALGDSAATTANEIFKGMQKSAAAAKVAGVSYEELTAMLTIGTSKTQMSGQVIGTAMQTIFSRMNRVTNKGYVNDETGVSVSINDVEKALSGAGIQLRKEGGKEFRNSFDVLRDLSKVWSGLSDIQRSNITYTMAGGRQTNVFQTLMEGMAEDNGAELDRLLGLAENSEGTTENKYAIAVRSITAAMEELKATYDGLVANLSNDNFIVGAVDGVSAIVGGLKDLTSIAPSVGTAITVIASAVALFATRALIAKAALGGATGLVTTLASVAAVAGVLGVAGTIGSGIKSMQNQNDPTVQAKEKQEIATKYVNSNQEFTGSLQKQIDEVKKYGDAWEEAKGSLSASDQEAFNSSLTKLSETLGNIESRFKGVKVAAEKWKTFTEGGQKVVDKANRDADIAANQVFQDTYLQTYSPEDLISAEKTAQHTASHTVPKIQFDENFRNNYLLRWAELNSPSLLFPVVSDIRKTYGNSISNNILNRETHSQEEDIKQYLDMLMNLAGIDVEDTDLSTKYRIFLRSESSKTFRDKIGADKLMRLGDDVYSIFEILTPEQQLEFLQGYSKFLTSSSGQGISEINKTAYTKKQEETIDEILNGNVSIVSLVGENEKAKKYLRDKLIKDTKDVPAKDLANAVYDNINRYMEQYSNPEEFLTAMKKENNDFDYYYTDKRGNRLFGFDDLDKAEEEYNKNIVSPDLNAEIKRLEEERLHASGQDIGRINAQLEQLNAERNKLIGTGFDKSRIVASTGLNAYQNLDQFIDNYEIKKDYKDVYQKMLSFAMKANTYDDMANVITEVEAQVPNLAGVMENDQEFAKMVKDLKGKTGRYSIDQFREYLQSKALQSSVSDFTLNMLTGNLAYGQELAAYNAMRSGMETTDQYDLIAKQWGVNRTNFEANKDLYMTLEQSRLNKIQQENAQGVNTYMQDLFGEYLNSISDEELKNIDKNSSLELFEEIKNRFAQTITDESAKQDFLNFMDAAKNAGYKTTLTTDRQFTTSYTPGAYAEENPLAANGNKFHTAGQIRSAAQGIFDFDLNADEAIKKYEEYVNEIKSAYPELYEWMNTTNQARKKELETEIKIKFKSEGIEDILKAGTLIKDLADLAAEYERGGVRQHEAQLSFNQQVQTIRDQAIAGQFASKLVSGDVTWANVPQQYRDLIKSNSTTYASQDDKDFIGHEKDAAEETIKYLNSNGYRQALVNTYGTAIHAGLMTQEQAESLGLTKGKGFEDNWFNSINYTAENALFDRGLAINTTDAARAKALVDKAATLADKTTTNEKVVATEAEADMIGRIYGSDVVDAITRLNSGNLTEEERNQVKDVLTTADLARRVKRGEASEEVLSQARTLAADARTYGAKEVLDIQKDYEQRADDLHSRIEAIQNIGENIDNLENLNALGDDVYQLAGINKSEFLNATPERRAVLRSDANYRAQRDYDELYNNMRDVLPFVKDASVSSYYALTDKVFKRFGWSSAYGLKRTNFNDLPRLSKDLDLSLFNPYADVQSENDQYALAANLYSKIINGEITTREDFGEEISKLTPVQKKLWEDKNGSGVLSTINNMINDIGNRENENKLDSDYNVAKIEYNKMLNTRGLDNMVAASLITENQAGIIRNLYGNDTERNAAINDVDKMATDILQMSQLAGMSYESAKAFGLIDKAKGFADFNEDVTKDNWEDVSAALEGKLSETAKYLPNFLKMMDEETASSFMDKLSLSYDENGNLVGLDDEPLLMGLYYAFKDLYGTEDIYSNKSNRDMIKKIFDEDMSLSTAMDTYKTQLAQSPEVLRYLQLKQLKDDGEDVDQKELDDLKKRAQRSFTNNPFVGYEPKMTSAETIDKINELLKSGDIKTAFDNLDDSIQNQLQSFPGLFDYIATYGQKNEAAAKATKTLADAIRNEAISALEEEGKVLSGLSSQMNTIVNGNVVDSTKGMNNLKQQITDLSEVQEAYNRITSGKGLQRQEDWDIIQNMFGISSTDIGKYQLDTNKLKADYGDMMGEVETLRTQSLGTAVDNILVDVVGDRAYKPEEPKTFVERIGQMLGFIKPKRTQATTEELIATMSEEEIEAANKRLAASGLGKIEGRKLIYGGKADAQLSLAQQLKEMRERRRLLGQGDQTRDYDKMLEYWRSSGGDIDSFINMVSNANDIGGIFKSTAAKDFFNNASTIEAVENGNADSILRLLMQGAGINYTNSTRMSDIGVNAVLQAVMNGDTQRVAQLKNNQRYAAILEYLNNNVNGFSDAYNTVLNGRSLEEYQKRALRGGTTYQALFERERNGEITAGTADAVFKLLTGNEGDIRSQIGGYTQSMMNLQFGLQALSDIKSGKGTNSNWQMLGTLLNLSDDEIDYYKKNIDQLNDLEKDVKDKEDDATSAMENVIDSLESVYGVNSFGDLQSAVAEGGNVLHQALLDAINRALRITNAEVIVDENGNTTITPTNKVYSYNDFIDSARNGSNFDNDQLNQFRLNEIGRFAYVALSSGLGMSNFDARMEAMMEGEGWNKNKKEYENFLSNNSELRNLFAQKGTISDDEFLRQLVEMSSYGIFNRENPYSQYMPGISSYLGKGFMNGDYSNVDMQGLQEYLLQPGNESANKWFTEIAESTGFLDSSQDDVDSFTSSCRKMAQVLGQESVKAGNKFNDSTENIEDHIKGLSGNSKEAATKLKEMTSAITGISKNQYFRQKYKKGDRSNDVISAIQEMTGADKKSVKKGDSFVKDLLDQQEKNDEQAIEEYGDSVGQMVANTLTGSMEEKLSSLQLNADQIQAVVSGGHVNVDMSQLINSTTGEVQAQLQFLAQVLASQGIKSHFDVSSDADGAPQIKLVVDTLGSGRGGGGGGGGGGGKSAAQKLLDRLKREQALLNHEIKMIQYQETKYENASEIGNQNRMIELENDAQKRLIATLEKHIETTKKQMSKTKKNSDDWKSLYDSVLAYEEAIEEANIAIQENTKKIEENEQAILKLHTDLEQEVNTEIENRIQRERDMLAGMVSVQDIILEAIRARYRAEWELIEKDIEKKRAALEEEKNLIDERLQRRKDAEDEAEKYEELAEYKKQLALIEMDSTRTKDAAKLREQIAKLEKDIAWDVAQDEADYQKEQIDNQLQAYDDFVTYGGEDLEEFLADANNMADEVNGVMQLSQEGMLDWLKANVEEYGQAMDAAQKQMIQGWIDTYEQMIGYTHTYWEEIADILSGKNLFLEYMKASQDYINASEDEQAQMLYNWDEMYDNWLAAQKRDAVYSHSDDGLSGLGTNGSKKKGGGNKTPTPTDDKGLTDVLNYINKLGTGNGNPVGMNAAVATSSEMGFSATTNRTVTLPKETINALNNLVKTKQESQYARYASGGLVDYTGPAWVDGSPMKPEAFLDADDTALIRSFLDEAKVVRYRSSISNIDSNSFGSNAQNIGELVINITEAQFKDDADFDEVAHRVGEKFVKELSKQGFNTMSYSF